MHIRIRLPSIFIFFFAHLFLVFSSFSQTISNVEGKVTDRQTGDPLPGANVLVVKTSLGASTDLNGNFVIRNVSPGSYMIRTAYVGYETDTVAIVVPEGVVVSIDLRLKPVGVQGKEVVVTAQASGQNAAINQQLASDQIVNVVSAAKIQELPDANAAESVGRLPGVSLIREGGEGSQVVIRGLAPQYNEITIDGVQMSGNTTPSTPSDVTASSNFGDRATDLSMILSSMLGGIEVTKAITPDMDAAVLGGVVNFDLREAQTSTPQFHLLGQDNYDNLQNTYNDYKFAADGEKRFFDDKLGIFAEGDIEQINLTSDVLGASYFLNQKILAVENPTYISNLNLTDEPRERQRYDATVVMDYRLPEGKIDLMNFASQGITDEQDRGESYSLTGNTHDYTLALSRNVLSQITNLFEVQKQFSFLNVDAKLSHVYSETQVPSQSSFSFQQSNAGIANPEYQGSNPELIPKLANDVLNQTFLFGLSASNSLTRERDLTGSLDLNTNVDFSDEVTSTVKFGGQYRYTLRSYAYNQGNGNVYYSGANVISGIKNAFPWMDSTINKYNGVILPLFVDQNFSYGNFLGGDYELGPPLNAGLLQQVLKIAQRAGTLEAWSPNSEASIQSNYSGDEIRTAGYGMWTLHLGSSLTFLPGVRYQNLLTNYTAPRGIVTTEAGEAYQYYNATTVESHGFWLPMVHLILKPSSWSQFHLAYTSTLTYPDFSAITPEYQIGIGSVDWHNYLLEPAHSSNYDAILSVYNNTIGLLSVDGFYKHINNLIFPWSGYILNPSLYPGLPPSTAGNIITTSFNDPYPVELWGIELDWETHFWYLPDPLSGLVLSANYTHIFSQAQYPYTYINVVSQFPPVADTINTYYKDRLLQQPDDIANLALGYDYKGFSIRVSMLYQANVFESSNFWPELRANTAPYLRWDIAAKQNLPWYGLQVFLDLNNINGERDIQIEQGSGFPAAESHYGMTADAGLRLEL